MSTWKDKLNAQILKTFGNKAGQALSEKYQHAFSTSFIEKHTVSDALEDIKQLELLSPENPFKICLYETQTNEIITLHTRFYQYGRVIALSDALPMLENMDIRTLSEHPYELNINNTRAWISDSSVVYKGHKKLDLKKINPLFNDAFSRTLVNQNENDGFNKLILGAELSWREIIIIRAYAKYLHQTRFRFSQLYIEKTVSEHSDIIRALIDLFYVKHDPTNKKHSHAAFDKLDKAIEEKLENVTSLDEDRILRRFLALIKATIRTNYFQNKPYLSFKFASSEVPELPLPHPLYEIYVYSPRFEGIHLRNEKVARGGIRWSDRREDFRTEVLGLMKAQKVKNAVIVPSGAKGGFVLKALPPNPDRATIQSEVIQCYQSFIRGLLDITDNLKNNKILPPENVVRYDDDDPYLVVAADKGTATFSDTANLISKEYDFWLGDAFASGGSAGYDHKKMGITARGAWESIKRHFRELELDINKSDFTVAGIGDMSGDVFGNGMIYCNRIKLIAAFDHRHIFLDPNPDAAKSYDERLRLFNLPTSSWEDYNSKLISKGGGVFKRTLKSIPLSSEIQKSLDIKESALTPNELIRAILKAPVDLLFNGGIGTYVKASTEPNIDVGDKTNEFCRINGDEIRAKIIGEGGNLGFTQLGRIEAALEGVLLNTDFIDNSAGVDCSDHEVNIKILLNKEMTQGKLTESKRNKLLAEMTDEVAALVLHDNYSQALTMSFSSIHAAQYCGLYQNFIKDLETQAGLNRAVEFLPDDKKLIERKAAGQGLTRPELAVLLAYTKIYIKKEILKSNLPEDTYYDHLLLASFPTRLAKLYPKELMKHSLRREIIATQLANDLVNSMGITFVYRMQTETGATVSEIVRAYNVAAEVYNTLALQKLIDSLNFKIATSLQYELLHHVRQLLNLATRWFLKGNRLQGDMSKIITHYRERIEQLTDMIPELIVGVTKVYLESLIEQFYAAGLPKDIARRVASARSLYTALNVIEVSAHNQLDFVKTTHVYFDIGSRFNLVWFRDQLAHDSREGHWNNLARLALRDELDNLQRSLTIVILQDAKKNKDVPSVIEDWLSQNKRLWARWEKLLEILHGSNNVDYTMFFITLRELSNLILAGRRAVIG